MWVKVAKQAFTVMFGSWAYDESICVCMRPTVEFIELHWIRINQKIKKQTLRYYRALWKNCDNLNFLILTELLCKIWSFVAWVFNLSV